MPNHDKCARHVGETDERHLERIEALDEQAKADPRLSEPIFQIEEVTEAQPPSL